MSDLVQAAIDRCFVTPGHRGLVFSANFSRSHRLWHNPPESVITNATRHSWLFPNGSSLTFGYPEVDRYRGSEFSFVDFDPDAEYFDATDVYNLNRRVRLDV